MESSLDILRRPDLSWADKLAYLAYEMSQEAAAAVTVRHIFVKGLYIREIALSADVVLVGRVHVKGHRMDLMYGALDLITETATVLHKAPDSMFSESGYQTVLHTLTPCICRTVHLNPSEVRDVSVLESEFFEPAGPVLERGAQVVQELLK